MTERWQNIRDWFWTSVFGIINILFITLLVFVAIGVVGLVIYAIMLLLKQ